MSPEKDVNFWIAVSGLLLGLWSTMLSYVLRAFGQRMDRIEAGSVPRPECNRQHEAQDKRLERIEDGVGKVHERIDDLINRLFDGKKP